MSNKPFTATERVCAFFGGLLGITMAGLMVLAIDRAGELGNDMGILALLVGCVCGVTWLSFWNHSEAPLCLK